MSTVSISISKAISGNPYRPQRRATVHNPNRSWSTNIDNGPSATVASGMRINEDSVNGGTF